MIKYLAHLMSPNIKTEGVIQYILVNFQKSPLNFRGAGQNHTDHLKPLKLIEYFANRGTTRNSQNEKHSSCVKLNSQIRILLT